jgi:hypothetical protein
MRRYHLALAMLFRGRCHRNLWRAERLTHLGFEGAGRIGGRNQCTRWLVQ